MMVTADPNYCEDIETDDKSFSSFSLPHIPPPFPKHDFWGKGSGAVEDLWRSLTPGPMGRLADQKEVTFLILPYSFSKFSKGNIGETPKKKFMSVASGQRLWHLKLPPEGGEALPSFAKQNFDVG